MPLSLIIPAYNSAATIRRCLDSIYALPLAEEEFEVIVVNDGSTDETGRIVEEYAKAHENLTMIRHLVNRNLGAARNTGLAAAKGDCIAFVDSDDEVVPGMVTALNMMEERELDMVAMRIEAVDEDGNVIGQMELPYSQDEVFSGIQLQEEHAYWSSAAWAYLYSKVILDSVRYPFVEGVFYEDLDFVCTHLYQAKRVSYCDEFCYRYYRNPFSISHTKSPRHAFGQAYLGARMLAIYKKSKEKSFLFADTVLEGGSYNLNKAFHSLFRLKSLLEVRTFYNMLEIKVDRKSLLLYQKSSHCYTYWARFGLRNPMAMKRIVSLYLLLHKLFNNTKDSIG